VPQTPVRILALGIIAAALVLGGWLRFADLGAREMSADEGASWAAASAPSLAEVIQLHTRLNPADIGVPDILLHEWITVFGDGLAAMRALSAALGTLAVALVFLATDELLNMPRFGAACAGEMNESSKRSKDSRSTSTGFGQSRDAGLSHGELIAATAALLFAVNLVAIKYSRQARMYPLMLVALLVQFTFFLRTLRRGGLLNCAGVAVFTALSLASHPSVTFAFAVEGLWLIGIVFQQRTNLNAEAPRRAFALIAAIAVGAMLLVPVLPQLLAATKHAARHGALDWIKRPPWWEPVALFNKGTGSFGFPVLMVLALCGAIGGWRRNRTAVQFCLLWMWAPPLIVLLFSYVIRPAFVERYLLSSFVPFFVLSAIGIWEIPNLLEHRLNGEMPLGLRAGMVTAATVFAVGVSLAHVSAYRRKAHGPQWREASVIAASIRPAEPTAVAPGYAIDVVRFYVRHSHNDIPLVRADPAFSKAQVLILGQEGIPPEYSIRLMREYPNQVAHLRGIVVRHR
jgi:uncharacterized membrane protein